MERCLLKCLKDQILNLFLLQINKKMTNKLINVIHFKDIAFVKHFDLAVRLTVFFMGH